MSILVTGAAGFIGFHLCKRLLEEGLDVIGFDNINDYYDVNLKYDRIKELNKKNPKYKGLFYFAQGDLVNKKEIKNIFNFEFSQKTKISTVINLAAQAGVRYSMLHPKKYNDNNINGFFNIIELSRIYRIKKIFYASSSSIYGDTKSFPLQENIELYPKNIYALSTCIIVAGLLIWASYDLPLVGQIDNPVQTHLAQDFIEGSRNHIGIPNVVTSILASYRGYDTFGETVVIYTAGIAVIVLLHNNTSKKNTSSPSSKKGKKS